MIDDDDDGDDDYDWEMIKMSTAKGKDVVVSLSLSPSVNNLDNGPVECGEQKNAGTTEKPSNNNNNWEAIIILHLFIALIEYKKNLNCIQPGRNSNTFWQKKSALSASSIQRHWPSKCCRIQAEKADKTNSTKFTAFCCYFQKKHPPEISESSFSGVGFF